MKSFSKSIVAGALLIGLSITRSYAQCECGVQIPAANPLSDSESLNVVREWLQAHNKYRCMHNVPPLVWSVSLSTTAGNWAGQCTLDHSLDSSRCTKPIPAGYLSACGENQLFGPSAVSPTKGVHDWVDGYDERSHERSNYEGFSNNYTVNYPMTLEQFNWDHDRVHNSGYAYYGHFTQVIWMNTKEVGCLTCPSTRADGYVGKAVCQYYPSGNATPQFAANVPMCFLQIWGPVHCGAVEAWCDPKSGTSYIGGDWVRLPFGTHINSCWQWSNGSYYVNEEECDVEWKNVKVTTSGELEYGNVTTFGSEPPPFDGTFTWKSSKGIRTVALDVGHDEICWLLLGAHTENGPMKSCGGGYTYIPPLQRILVDGKGGCWTRLKEDHTIDMENGIIWCEF